MSPKRKEMVMLAAVSEDFKKKSCCLHNLFNKTSHCLSEVAHFFAMGISFIVSVSTYLTIFVPVNSLVG